MYQSKQKLSNAQAKLKLALWDAEATSASEPEVYSWLQSLGLPEEVVTRLHELLSFTQKIGSKIVAIGKIVLLKILEFVQAHPCLVAGMGIGVAIGAVLVGLVGSIPLLGPILIPIAATLGIIVTGAGAVVGHRLDKQIGRDVSEVIQEFFGLLIDVFNTLFPDVVIA